MHSAPSVIFPVGRCRFYAGALTVLAVSGALALGAWQAHSGAALALVWAVFAAWSWMRSPVGQLGWSARTKSDEGARPGTWQWHSATCPEGAPLARVELVLDLQSRVLLRLHNADAIARWIWVERARDPSRWNDLRRALVSARH